MTRKLVVSDHAVLRYLERVHGVDLEGLRRRIAREAASVLTCPIEGATAVRKNGVRYAITDLRVVTVGPIEMMPYDPAIGRRPRRGPA